MKTKELKKNKKRDITNAEIEKKSTLYSEFIRDAEKIDTLSNQIDNFKSGDKLQRLAKIDAEISSITKEIAENENAMENLTPQLKALQKKVDDQDGSKKNVISNIELFDIIENKETVEAEMGLLQEQLIKLDVATVEENYNAMKEKIRKMEVKISRFEGKKETLRSQLRELQVNLPQVISGLLSFPRRKIC